MTTAPIDKGWLIELIAICEQFEAAWKAGTPQPIEQFVSNVVAERRNEVVLDLIQLEMHHRKGSKQPPTPVDYCERFPELKAEIEGLFPTTPQQNFPAFIGEFRVERLLGSGGFGAVYLAMDTELNRRVAIKVPRRLTPTDLVKYRDEAQKLAKLEHPGVVPIYHIGHSDEFPVFLVTKLVEGGTLTDWVKRSSPDFLAVARLVADVAEALHATHLKDIFHRDIKPANILVDLKGRPYLADFGLALQDGEGLDASPEILGTPDYMSPEQAAGEGHRVDGSTDIFSLGVVLYELLAGKRPFRPSEKLPSRERLAQLLELVKTAEPRPPRQINDQVPKRLEEICLKALAKRKPDRYTTARDMAEDLRHFAANPAAQAVASVRIQLPSAHDASTQPQTPTPGGASTPQVISDREPLKIVPKGLRSFDAGDASFFLDLLPGPRDRDGLPDSLRFWKTRIESFDPEVTFAAGVLYGPSGCGKSSLVNAALIPHLAEHVVPIYIEAAGDDTELRLSGAIRRACPQLDEDLSLTLLLTSLRCGVGLPNGKKVLLVLDQFEQWLHARRKEANKELPRALRQCDGERLQCLILVRGDYWEALSRFFKELEIPLIQDRNCAMADLFDPPHARKVLDAFGVAFGRAPVSRRSYDEFLDKSVTALTKNDKIISVRLALFAWVIRFKPWTSQTFKAIGGVEGALMTFLEETFSASDAPDAYRTHENAVREILNALLPDSGTEIKKPRVSVEQLQAATELTRDPHRFAEVLRILDQDLRLITPVSEPLETQQGGLPPATPNPQSPIQNYQLSHDYLVESIRNWLTKRQKETWRGRAQLWLEERTAQWMRQPQSRYLPSLFEFTAIVLGTSRRHRTTEQQSMMRRATQHHVLRCGSLLLLVGLVVSGLYMSRDLEQQRQKERALDMVTELTRTELANVPQLVTDLKPLYRKWADPALRQIVKEKPELSKASLHASLALLPVDESQAEFILQRLLTTTDPEQVVVLRKYLHEHQAKLTHQTKLTESLWKILEENRPENELKLFQAASMLTQFDADNDKWNDVAGRLAERMVKEHDLLEENASRVIVSKWSDMLQPPEKLKNKLFPLFSDVLLNRDRNQRETQIDLASKVLVKYAPDDVSAFGELLLDAEPKQVRTLFDEFVKHGDAAEQVLHRELDKRPERVWGDKPLDPKWPAIKVVTLQIIENAHGLVAERFAFCQTLPIEQLTEVTSVLAKSGYRPVSVRPTAAPVNTVIVAVVWWRDDGRDSQLLHGLTADEVIAKDEKIARPRLGVQRCGGICDAR